MINLLRLEQARWIAAHMQAQDPNGIWTWELYKLECPDATEAEWAEATLEAASEWED